MQRLKQLLAPIVVFFLLAPEAPLAARTRKGEHFRALAHTEELKGNFDKALGYAEQAVSQDPSDPAYIIELRRLKFQAGNSHLKEGQKLRSAGKLDAALAEFQKAYGLDPSSDIAGQEIQRTKQMIDRNKAAENPQPASKPALPAGALADDEKSLTPAELSHKRSMDKAESMLPVPELRPLNADAINLKMSNKPRVLFETIGKVAGINVLFDPEYDSQQQIRSQNVDLLNTTLDQALDQLGVVTKSYWKPLSANTIFVTVDNPQKRREYEEHVVKIFYLSNVTTPQEIQEMQTVLRTVVDVSKVFPYTSQNALIVRAEADKMALVEKIIADLDKPRSEVIIDVMVLEANSTYIRNLAASFAGAGITTSAAFNPRSAISTTTSSTSTSTTGTATTTGTTTIPFSNLGRISTADYAVTGLPGAMLEAVLNNSGTRVLQAPQVRAVDNFKASLKIGDKVPTATGSFQPGVGSVGVNALVNTQFTFIDVGVNIEITPKVHDNGEVSLHLDIDVSQVKDRIDLGGISQPEIGQRKSTQDIRVREGEISVIGGLMQQQDSKAKTGIPGLANIPIFGRLFSTENVEHDRTEILITLIPHIVRGPDISDTNLKSIASGNSTTFKVAYAAKKAVPGEKPKDNLVTTPSSVGPAAAPPATAPPIPVAPAPVVAPQGPPQASGPARMSFTPALVDTNLASAVNVTIYAENVSDMISAAAQLRYDPKILRLTNIIAGDLPQGNGSQLQPSKNILNDTGTADFSVSRGPQDAGVSGSGGLFTAVFQTVGRGNTQVTLGNVALQASTKQPINTTSAPPLVVNVK